MYKSLIVPLINTKISEYTLVIIQGKVGETVVFSWQNPLPLVVIADGPLYFNNFYHINLLLSGSYMNMIFINFQ